MAVPIYKNLMDFTFHWYILNNKNKSVITSLKMARIVYFKIMRSCLLALAAIHYVYTVPVMSTDNIIE